MQLVAADTGLSKENPVRSAVSIPPIALPRWVPWAILLIAAGFRLAWLDLKPAHFDEGINGWFVDQMVKNGFYRYDPTNYHGPLHFYVEFLSLTLFGRNLWALRLPVVLVGLGTVWLAWAWRRHLGDRPAAFAALGLALSPGFVFFERYAIHEVWLVFFLMQLTWGILEILNNGTRRGLLAIVIGATGCILTKETYALHFFAIGLTFLAYALWQYVAPFAVWRIPRPRWTQDQLWQMLTLALFAILFFYSGNFFNWHGLTGIFTTFSTWAQTGVESAGHAKKAQQLAPFLNYYWLWLGWKFEPLMLLGCVTGLATLFPWEKWGKWFAPTHRWLALYAWAVLCGYSLIAYKTPWCIISIAWPFYLLAGVALDRLLRLPWAAFSRPIVLLGTFAAYAWTTERMVMLNFRRYDDDTLPYVYVQTYRDVHLLLDPIAALLRRDPSMVKMKGKMHLDSYYPLPWYFGDLDKVYCPKPGVYSADEDCDFLLCESDRADDLASHLKEAYYRVPFRLRSGQSLCTAFFNAGTFGPEFNNRDPDLPAKDDPAAEDFDPEETEAPTP